MRIKSFHLLATILCVLAAPAAFATTPQDFAGTWAMRIGKRNLFVLHLTVSPSGISGTCDRPSKLSGTNSIFDDIRGPVRHDTVIKTLFENGALHFTVQNANDPNDEDNYVMSVDGDHAQLNFDNLPADVVLDPRSFERVPDGAQVATDWQPNRAYVAGDSDTPSAEMKAIFDEDQRVRMPSKPDWPAITRTDSERRERTSKLLASGALHTGKDYEEAAFVFQHGDSPQDYLLAHTLAMVAVSKGDALAIWIAAATLDRYLQKIGQPQIFGTQFSRGAKTDWTQDPYDRTLVSDALRQQLGVPSQASQAKRLQAFSKQN